MPTICLPNPDPVTGRKICIHIPLLIVPWWKRFVPLGPDDRFSDVFGPSPEPWLLGVREGLGRDLSALATIDALARTLPDSAGRAIGEAVRGQLGNLGVPKGMEVHFDREG